MALQNIQTGRLVEPYGGDPADKITAGLAGLGAALLQVGQFMQGQAQREQQIRGNYELQIKKMQGERELDLVKQQHDLVKLKIDQMNLQAKQLEGGQAQREEIMTQMVNNASFLPGVKIDTIDRELNDISDVVVSAQHRNSSDILSALVANSPELRAAASKIRGGSAEEETLKAEALSLARQRMDLLRRAQKERQNFMRIGTPVTSPVAEAGLAAPVSPLNPTDAAVPRPPALGRVQITGIPQDQAALGQFLLQQVGPGLSAMARRDPDQARVWWGQFTAYYNVNRPAQAGELNAADFGRIVR